MSGKKLIAVSWWTFAYAVAAGAVFAFTAMGDCPQGTQGAACAAQQSTFIDALLVVEVLGYAALTWLFFFRRR